MRTTFALLLALSLASPIFAQTKPPAAGAKKASPQASTSSDDAIKKMIHDAEPGPIHKEMAQRAGDYTRTTRLIQPGAPPAENKSNARFVPIIGGRFLMEGDGGTPGQTDFSGFRLWGYNNASKHYEAISTYGQSTAMIFMSGAASPDGKVVTYRSGWEKAPGATERVTITVTQLTADKFVLKMVGSAGEQGPVLEETYERVKIKKK